MASSSLPRGFSVHQPAIGAPLQFFPPLRSQELESLINAYIPGASSAHEKRAAISLDFVEHSQATGQNFKFYAVNSAPSPAASSPATASPSLDSVNSSFNVSPVTSNWDWSATSVASSRHSTGSRRASKTNSPPQALRHNFTQIPGMKILTKDGLDVTETAARGTKTKEQRDHAHLMRIIKACDSCRRKKIRCDPSHKKRGSQQAVSDAGVAKPTKKARAAVKPPSGPKPAVVSTETELPSSVLGLDPSFSLDSLESFDFDNTLPYDPMDDFIQFPPMDESEDFGFLLDSSDFTSSQSSAAASPFKSQTPSSQLEPSAPPGAFVNPELQERQSPFSFMDGSVSGDYTDFNLYSPQSTFSEDERMLSLASSTGSLNPAESHVPGCPPPGSQDFFGVDGVEWSNGGNGPLDICTDTDVLHTGIGDMQAGPLSVSDMAQPGDQFVIDCPPGTVVLGGDAHRLNNVSNSFHVSQSIAQALSASESPGVSSGLADGVQPSRVSIHVSSGNSANTGSDGVVLSGVSNRTESIATDLDRGAAASTAVSASDDQPPVMTTEGVQPSRPQSHLVSSSSANTQPGLEQISAGSQIIATTEPDVGDVAVATTDAQSRHTSTAGPARTQASDSSQTTVSVGGEDGADGGDATGVSSVASGASRTDVRSDVASVPSDAVSVDSGASASAIAATDSRHVVRCANSSDFIGSGVQASLSAPAVSSLDLLALASSVVDAAVLSLIMAASTAASTLGPNTSLASSARLSSVSGVVTCRQRLRQSPSGIHTARPAMVSTFS